MKANIKRLLSLVLSAALTSTMLFSTSIIASAADDYGEMVKWEFGGNDAYSNNWTKGGYTTSGLTPTYTITDGRLEVAEDYTGLTSTYNRVMAQYNFTETAQLDISNATKITFDYYCKTNQTPNQFLLVFSGKKSTDAGSTTVTEGGSFANTATKYDTSDIVGYDKYAVTISMTESETNVEQRAHVARM